MAKKRRKKRVRLSPAQMMHPGLLEKAKESPDVMPLDVVLDAAELEEEYAHVTTDLRRLGLVAGVVLALLVVVALVAI